MDHPWIPSDAPEGKEKTIKINPVIPGIRCQSQGQKNFFKE
jgi:hypothetical protein